MRSFGMDRACHAAPSSRPPSHHSLMGIGLQRDSILYIISFLNICACPFRFILAWNWWKRFYPPFSFSMFCFLSNISGVNNI